MPKRMLKDIRIDRKSSGEAIITVEIWSDVSYLDNRFVSQLLNETDEEDDNTSGDEKSVISNIAKILEGLNENYRNVEYSEDMSEQDIYVMELSKSMASDITASCISAIRPSIKALLSNKPKAESSNLQDHVEKITQLIDIMKSHLGYIPTLQERDKLMFRMLDDLKTYSIMGEKFNKIENFTNFWKLREQIAPAKSYSIGIKGKSTLPPI